MKKLMGWQPDQFDNRYAFSLGVLAYIGHGYFSGKWLLSIPVELVIVFVKATLGGVGGLTGKWMYGLIRRAVIELFKYKRRRNEKKP